MLLLAPPAWAPEEFAMNLAEWEPQLHPRDSHGRFRDKWGLPPAIKNAIEGILKRFSPATFRNDAHAQSFAEMESKKQHHDPLQQASLDYFMTAKGAADIQSTLRAGRDDTPHIRGIDQSMKPLTSDIMVTRIVGPDAFGLTPETIGAVEEWTGKLGQDHGFSPAIIGTPPTDELPHITLNMVVPKGTKVSWPGGSRTVILDREQPFRIMKVEPDGHGGVLIRAVVEPKLSGGKRAPARALGKELPHGEHAPSTSATPDELAKRGLDPNGNPIPEQAPGVPGDQLAPGAPGVAPAPVASAPGANAPAVTPGAPASKPLVPQAPAAPAAPAVTQEPDVGPPPMTHEEMTKAVRDAVHEALAKRAETSGETPPAKKATKAVKEAKPQTERAKKIAETRARKAQEAADAKKAAHDEHMASPVKEAPKSVQDEATSRLKAEGKDHTDVVHRSVMEGKIHDERDGARVNRLSDDDLEQGRADAAQADARGAEAGRLNAEIRRRERGGEQGDGKSAGQPRDGSGKLRQVEPEPSPAQKAAARAKVAQDNAKLAEEEQAANAPKAPRKRALPTKVASKAAGEPKPKARTIADIRADAEKEGIPLPKRALKADLEKALADGRSNKGKPEAPKVEAPTVAGRPLPAKARTIAVIRAEAEKEGIKLPSRAKKEDLEKALADGRAGKKHEFLRQASEKAGVALAPKEEPSQVDQVRQLRAERRRAEAPHELTPEQKADVEAKAARADARQKTANERPLPKKRQEALDRIEARFEEPSRVKSTTPTAQARRDVARHVEVGDTILNPDVRLDGEGNILPKPTDAVVARIEKRRGNNAGYIFYNAAGEKIKTPSNNTKIDFREHGRERGVTAPKLTAAETAKVEKIGSALHADWQKTQALLDDGTRKPKMKPTKDGAWVKAHGGATEVDIANTPFADLPEDWQKDNRDAAVVVQRILKARGGKVDLSDEKTRLEVGDEIHKAWLERHGTEEWVKESGLDKPFAELPRGEQDKDTDQVKIAMESLAQAPRKRALPTKVASKAAAAAPAAKPAAPAPEPKPAAPKMSSKPLFKNTWGGASEPNDVHFHPDGVIGRAIREMGADAHLDVDGEPLANVMGRIATDTVSGKISPRQSLDELKKLEKKLPDGLGRRHVAMAISSAEGPDRDIELPSGSSPALAKLAKKLGHIPLASREGKAGRDSEVNRVKALAEQLRTEKISRIRAESELLGIANNRHESQGDEGKYHIDRAIKEAHAELEEERKEARKARAAAAEAEAAAPATREPTPAELQREEDAAKAAKKLDRAHAKVPAADHPKSDEDIVRESDDVLDRLRGDGATGMEQNRALDRKQAAQARIDAAQPRPTDPEGLARWKMAQATVGRDVAHALSELDELSRNGASEEAMAHRMQTAGRKLAPDVEEELTKAGLSGDRAKVDRAIEKVAKRYKLTSATVKPGQSEPFDRSKHTSIGADFKEGNPAEVVRQGWSREIDGKEVQLSKAQVSEVHEKAPAGSPADELEKRRALRAAARAKNQEAARADLIGSAQAELNELAAKKADHTLMAQHLRQLATGPKAEQITDPAERKHFVDTITKAADQLDEGKNVDAVSTLRRLAREHKVETVGKAGEIEPFDRGRHEGVHEGLKEGEPVRVIRPGVRVIGEDGIPNRIQRPLVTRAPSGTEVGQELPRKSLTKVIKDAGIEDATGTVGANRDRDKAAVMLRAGKSGEEVASFLEDAANNLNDRDLGDLEPTRRVEVSPEEMADLRRSDVRYLRRVAEEVRKEYQEAAPKGGGPGGYQDRVAHVAEVSKRPVVGKPQKLSGGAYGEVHLVKHEGGEKLIDKVYGTRTDMSAKEMRDTMDAETLGPQVLEAVGVRAAAVHTTDKRGQLLQEYLEGRTGADSHIDDKMPSSLVDSDDGRLMGLADAIMTNVDRNVGNFTRLPGGRLGGFDHGSAFQLIGAFDGISSQFGHYLVDGTHDHFMTSFKPSGWKRSIDLSSADMAIIRARLEALAPEFEAAGRGKWFRQMMQRFGAIEKNAKGTKNRVTP